MDVLMVCGAALVSCSIVLAFWLLVGEPQRNAAQSNLARDSLPADSRQAALAAPVRERILDPVFAAIARRAGGFVGRSGTERTRRTLELGGLYDSGWTVERVLVIRVLLVAASALAAVFFLSGGIDRITVLMALVAIGVGLLGPKAWLDRAVSERRTTIERALPDLIDQLTVSVEAGLGFDASLARAVEGRTGPLVDEVTRVLQDLRVGVSRQHALERMVARTEVTDLGQFVTAVRQATVHGVPMARVLAVQSEELRSKRRSRAERRAASLPVKIVFPLVFCILPSLFVVILGPAVLDLTQGF